MTSRERVERVLNHHDADRPVIDIGGTCDTGISVWSYQKLRQALGLEEQPIKVLDMFQMLAEVGNDVQDALGGDFLLLPRIPSMLGLEASEWKSWRFWDGQTFLVPADFCPNVKPNGALEVLWKGSEQLVCMPPGCHFFEFASDTSLTEDYMKIDLIPESQWSFIEHLNDDYLENAHDEAQQYYEITDKALVSELPFFLQPGGLQLPVGYGNLYQWAILMKTEPAHCRDYMMRHAEALKQCLGEYLQAVGPFIQVIALSYADFGLQGREVFEADLFKEFFVPAWKLVCDAIHRDFPHLKIFVHSCGSIPNFIPHFIEAGVDILNPVQWTARGMSMDWLKNTFGDKLTFWGGAVSTQQTLPQGSPEDVEYEVNSILKIMVQGGGYVACAIHNILPEVPVENTLALYRAAKQFR